MIEHMLANVRFQNNTNVPAIASQTDILSVPEASVSNTLKDTLTKQKKEELT